MAEVPGRRIKTLDLEDHRQFMLPSLWRGGVAQQDVVHGLAMDLPADIDRWRPRAGFT